MTTLNNIRIVTTRPLRETDKPHGTADLELQIQNYSELGMGEVTAVLTLSAKDAGELGRMFQAIGRALESIDAAPDEAAPPSAEAAADAAAWYVANGGRFVRELRPAARQALGVIVERGPVVPMDDVAEAVGMRGSKLAGSLASIGAAVSRLDAPAPPYSADHKRRQYEISPGVQEALRRHI